MSTAVEQMTDKALCQRFQEKVRESRHVVSCMSRVASDVREELVRRRPSVLQAVAEHMEADENCKQIEEGEDPSERRWSTQNAWWFFAKWFAEDYHLEFSVERHDMNGLITWCRNNAPTEEPEPPPLKAA